MPILLCLDESLLLFRSGVALISFAFVALLFFNFIHGCDAMQAVPPPAKQTYSKAKNKSEMTVEISTKQKGRFPPVTRTNRFESEKRDSNDFTKTTQNARVFATKHNKRPYIQVRRKWIVEW